MYVHCVFTSVGHSFGGALACTVMANMVCDNDIINQEVMKMNMCCITFGQPLIADDTLAEMMAQKEQLHGCVHHIYTEDVVPTLLRYAFASAVGKHSVQEQATKTSVSKVWVWVVMWVYMCACVGWFGTLYI